YAAFLAAAKSLPVRRLRPGLKFDLRRLKTDSIARRVTVRLSPERRLTLVRREGETGWVETVETIPWAITRLRVTGAIESSLYDALDKAMADSFLPAPERRQLAWAIADVYDWEVDFSRDIRPGDRFTVLLERLESSEGERRFGPILAARGRVARRETIGYVGSTGLSPGQHLHYEFLVNGRPTNPRGKYMGAGTPVPNRLTAAFDTARDGLRILLEPKTSPLPTARPITAARD